MKRKSGFSILETLVAIVILGIFIVIIGRELTYLSAAHLGSKKKRDYTVFEEVLRMQLGRAFTRFLHSGIDCSNQAASVADFFSNPDPYILPEEDTLQGPHGAYYENGNFMSVLTGANTGNMSALASRCQDYDSHLGNPASGGPNGPGSSSGQTGTFNFCMRIVSSSSDNYFKYPAFAEVRYDVVDILNNQGYSCSDFRVDQNADVDEPVTGDPPKVLVARIFYHIYYPIFGSDHTWSFAERSSWMLSDPKGAEF